MCEADIRLGRKSRSRRLTVALDTASGLAIRANPQRIALMFFRPPTNRYTVAPFQTVAIDKGLTMAPTSPTETLTIQTHGDMVRSEWHGISDTGAQDIEVWETEWTDPEPG